MTVAPELAARLLQIDVRLWHATLDDFARAAAPADADARLAAAATAYGRRSPHATPLPASAAKATRQCPCCAGTVRACLARRPGLLVFGRCDRCGHGMLLDGGAADASVYRDAAYYQRRDERGVGYDRYLEERAYREAKGDALVARIAAAAPDPPTRLLEVGSGFGFTRVAAQRRGLATAGVDASAHAAETAAALHGMRTFVGTLSAACAGGDAEIAAGGFDVVLYQFVLEHVADPVRELAVARGALAPGGLLALLVPSMEAREIDVFGASYRSFRADHLHLFSRQSLRLCLRAAGLAPRSIESESAVHLLAPFIGDEALAGLYRDGLGPDLFAVAARDA